MHFLKCHLQMWQNKIKHKKYTHNFVKNLRYIQELNWELWRDEALSNEYVWKHSHQLYWWEFRRISQTKFNMTQHKWKKVHLCESLWSSKRQLYINSKYMGLQCKPKKRVGIRNHNQKQIHYQEGFYTKQTK